MPLVATLLFTAVLAILIPRIRTSALRRAPKVIEKINQGLQSQRSRDFARQSAEAARPVLRDIWLCLSSVLGILFATLLQIVGFVRPRILSATRSANESSSTLQDVTGGREEAPPPNMSFFFGFLWLVDRATVVAAAGVVVFCKSMWYEVDQEVKSWEKHGLSTIGGAPADASSEADSLTQLASHLKTTLAVTPDDPPSSSGGSKAAERPADLVTSPTADMHKDLDTGLITLALELPGVPKDAVHITLRSGELEVACERVVPASDALRVQCIMRERKVGRFVRIVEGLPASLKSDDIKASMDMGVLTLTFPSEEVAQPTFTIAVI